MMQREFHLRPQQVDGLLAGETTTERKLGRLADFLADVRATFLVSPEADVRERHLTAMSQAFERVPKGNGKRHDGSQRR
jgi:hypothetical protein